VLNERLLPRQYYALAAQHGAGFEPDFLTLKSSKQTETPSDDGEPPFTDLTAVSLCCVGRN
jgi:hypothetical protein